MKVFITKPRQIGSYPHKWIFVRFFTKHDEFCAIRFVKKLEDILPAAQDFADRIRAYKKDPAGYIGAYG